MSTVGLGGIASLALFWLFAGTYRTYRIHEHNWCGFRLLLTALLQASPPVFVLLVIYAKLTPLLEWPVLRRYEILLTIPLVVAADFLTRRAFQALDKGAKKELPVVPVTRRIAKKKITLADSLLTKQDCRLVLEKAIDVYDDLPTQQRKRLKQRLSPQPTRSEILEVINTLGLARVKYLV